MNSSATRHELYLQLKIIKKCTNRKELRERLVTASKAVLKVPKNERILANLRKVIMAEQILKTIGILMPLWNP
ncbi:unnamed protein product [Blepharisma stoltei]|uniref:Uncharacterized protein n=1 Tax=Blepharisma stoltei TaxID=1481888 RepID=A0AAU9IW46_9CILI|nr:unnamed protein product [Blepharisma stoltei]